MIIPHCFRVTNNEGESVIGYDMISIHDVMVNLGLMSD